MTRQFDVASVARKPVATAFESDRDDITLAVVMCTAGLAVDFDTDNLGAVNFSPHE
jgi:hypothetical protein